MKRINDRCRDNDCSSKSKARRPLLESLEDRCLLSSLEGGQWTYGSRITYSFMPDGTNIGGVSSSLFSTMNSGYSTAAWQQAIEKAAAIWEQVANINLTLVSDNGEMEGASGDQQDDPNVGDIRIGSIPEDASRLAFTMIPPPINGGTDAGDMFFNSSQTWGSRGYDLETVAIHEFGHALGLGESAVEAAVMYTYYNGINTTLASDDISAIQSLYGTIPTNTATNHSASTATNITSLINGNGQIALSGENIASSTQYDWYAVTVPSNTTGSMVVSMQSSNLSSLSPRLTLYNSLTVGIGESVAPNVYGATVSYTVSNVVAGQLYYIRAGAANSGPGGNGAYGLTVNFTPTTQKPAAVTYNSTPSAFVVDQAGNLDDLLVSSGTWSSLGHPSGVTLVGSPSALAFGSTQALVYATGSDGNLYFNMFGGSTWSGWYNMGHPTGVSIVGSPSSINYGAWGMDNFVRGSDNNLYELGFNGSTWAWSTLSTAGNLAGDPTATTFGTSGVSVYENGTDGHLHAVYSANGSTSWGWTDVGNGGYAVAGNPTVVVGTTTAAVYDRDVNGNINEAFYTGSSWSWGNLGNPGSGITITGNPTVGIAGSLKTVYATAADGELHWDTWNGSSWTWDSTSTAPVLTGGAPALMGSNLFAFDQAGNLEDQGSSGWVNLKNNHSLLGGNPIIIAPPNTVVASQPDEGGGSENMLTHGASSHHHGKGHGHGHVGASNTPKSHALSIKSVPKGPHHKVKPAR